MTTLLQQLEQDINRAAFARVADVLFNKELTRHTRRGHRECTCEYCVEKQHATAEVALAVKSIKYEPRRDFDPNRDVRWWGCGLRYTDEWLLKFTIRNRVRKKVRKRLQELIEKD